MDMVLTVHFVCFTHRMNDGPILGHEDDVGKRTTFRLFYPESVFSDPNHYDPNTTVVLIAFKPSDLKWLWSLLIGDTIVGWQTDLPITFSSMKKKMRNYFFLFISEH